MSLAKKLKERREFLGMSRYQLAREAGLTQPTISRIESGQIKTLNSQALKRLAGVLRVTVDWLVDATDEMTAEDGARVNEDVRFLFRGYEQLDETGRELLKGFLKAIKQQHGRGEAKKQDKSGQKRKSK